MKKIGEKSKMTSLEITGENAKQVVDMVVGIFGPRIMVPVEGKKDEPMRKVQESEKLSDAGNVQTKEGLGEASAENETYEVEELVRRLYAAGNYLRIFAKGEDTEEFGNIAGICFDAARTLMCLKNSIAKGGEAK